MSNHIIHTTLCYRHNQLSDETLNIAVLAIFPEGEKVELLCPSKPELNHRLKNVYTDIPVDLIWQYLSSFKSKAQQLSGKLKSYLGNYEQITSDHFLIDNGSSLFFGELEVSPIWKDEPQTLIALHRRFLSGYEREQSETSAFITERHIATKVRELIKESFDKKNTDYQLYFREEQRTFASGVFQFTSSGFWKNGTENLVHPLSLDVKTADRIVSKCLLISKSAELLREKAEAENVNFHLLLAKPHLKDLQSAYEDSVGVLEEDTKAPIKVFRPEQQFEYATTVVAKAVSLV